MTTTKKANGSGKFEISLDHWNKMSDLEAWDKALRDFALPTMYAELAKMVKAWPFESDPSDVKSYSDLTFDEFGDVLAEAREQAQTFFLVALKVR